MKRKKGKVNQFLLSAFELGIKKFCKLIEYKEKTEVIAKKWEGIVWLVYCERYVKYEKFKTSMNLNHLIKWCLDQKILSKTTLDKFDNIRKIRNGVHIAAIMDAKDIFSYKDLDKILKDIISIFQEIRDKYNKL